jgi:hypothetical protein
MGAHAIQKTVDMSSAAATAIVPQVPIPAMVYALQFLEDNYLWVIDDSWEERSSAYYIIDGEVYEQRQQLEIIGDFAKNLINNSIDLDPVIAKALDKNFWDLV